MHGKFGQNQTNQQNKTKQKTNKEEFAGSEHQGGNNPPLAMSLQLGEYILFGPLNYRMKMTDGRQIMEEKKSNMGCRD